MSLFTAKKFVEQSAIEEKIKLLSKFCNKELTTIDIEKIITTRRIHWIKNNITRLKYTYRHLPPH